MTDARYESGGPAEQAAGASLSGDDESERVADPARVMIGENVEIQSDEVSATPSEDLEQKDRLISNTAIVVALVMIAAVVLIAALAT